MLLCIYACLKFLQLHHKCRYAVGYAASIRFVQNRSEHEMYIREYEANIRNFYKSFYIYY